MQKENIPSRWELAWIFLYGPALDQVYTLHIITPLCKIIPVTLQIKVKQGCFLFGPLGSIQPKVWGIRAQVISPGL